MGQAFCGGCCGIQGLPSIVSFRSRTLSKNGKPHVQLGIREEKSKIVYQRTSKRSVFRVRCVEAECPNKDSRYPVKLVVFDLDETLTMCTFMTPSGTYRAHEYDWAKKANFETPWVEGQRLLKLQKLLADLAQDQQGRPRALAILTKNQHRTGVAAVLNLLKVADLATHFSAIWCMPWRHGVSNGAYKQAGKWKFFEPPVNKVRNHKADVLDHIARNPGQWFPQLAAGDAQVKPLQQLKPEGIVLVDDQRSNFTSDSGTQVTRYCKVARYDAHFFGFGLLKDMGGIGAHDDADYDTLKRFVMDPWLCKETFKVRCLQKTFDGNNLKRPVRLVVFDFDETLTLATFMPQDPACRSQIGWRPIRSDEWTEEDLVTYNFESPWVSGSRVAKLQKLLAELANGQRLTLAILTRNEGGAVAVLNLLKMAKLADFFSAVWTFSATSEGVPTGVYQDGGQWRVFNPPVDQVPDHKADVMKHIYENLRAWFPQLDRSRNAQLKELLEMAHEGMVLVDDERANFSSIKTKVRVLRFCKVSRYDNIYRDCGQLNQMGGIGAHSDEDYETLKQFLLQPWEYPYEPSPVIGGETDEFREDKAAARPRFQLLRADTDDEVSKRPRTRMPPLPMRPHMRQISNRTIAGFNYVAEAVATTPLFGRKVKSDPHLGGSSRNLLD